MENAPATSSATVGPPVRPGGFLPRLSAAVLDALVLAPVAFLLFEPAFEQAHGLAAAEASVLRDAWRYATYDLVLLLYSVLMLIRRSRTLGMMPFKLCVTTLDGSPLPSRRAALRTLTYVAPLLLAAWAFGAGLWLVFGIAHVLFWGGLLWMIVDPRNQALHDKIAGTLVIVSPSYPAAPAAARPDHGPEQPRR
jgi:uncharacterized RDD family membrane protein YckC